MRKKIGVVFLMILVLIGSITLTKNLKAEGEYSEEFIKCEKYCWEMAQQGYDYASCIIAYCIEKL